MKKTLITALLCTAMSQAIGQAPFGKSFDSYPPYYGSDLQLTYANNQSKFTFWSPNAEEVYLHLYNEGEGGIPYQTLKMVRNNPSEPWHITVGGDLKGRFYTFQIKYQGKLLNETQGAWANAVGINGNRAAVVDLKSTNPTGWSSDKRPPLKSPNDIILYELVHRDMTMSPTSGIKHKGKFLAWTEKGSKNGQGQSTGIDHIKELGVTHVHLLPSFDHASIDEKKLDENKYNWGYDPKNFNAPEGSFSTNPADPSARIKEFKQMVQSFHKNGIRVIMDVVYNHTSSAAGSAFNLSVPEYFYRHNPDGSYSNASGCGNETASERTMVRQYIVESVKYWATEYHIDGFRFDLMAVHDVETMNAVTKALHEIDPSIFVYGEGWSAGDSPLPLAKRATKANALLLNDVAVFSDDIRDGIKGHFAKETEKGFATGAPNMEESVKFGIVASTQHPQVDYSKVNYSKAPYAKKPSQTISYVSCHDDLCLVDKLRASNPGASENDLIKYNKLAQTIVLTSQGIPFIFCGEEIFRDKKGVHNSFQSPDSINSINWNNKAKYNELFKYYQGLINLRKKHPAFRIPTTEGIQKHLKFIDAPAGVVAYQLSGNANGDSWKDIVAVFNGNTKAAKVSIPVGKWIAIIKDGKINEKGISPQNGGVVEIPASSALLLKR